MASLQKSLLTPHLLNEKRYYPFTLSPFPSFHSLYTFSSFCITIFAFCFTPFDLQPLKMSSKLNGNRGFVSAKKEIEKRERERAKEQHIKVNKAKVGFRLKTFQAQSFMVHSRTFTMYIYMNESRSSSSSSSRRRRRRL